MIQTGFEKRVSVQQIIEHQVPDFILSESPKTVDFLKQYYISQEHQSGPSDIAVNLDQYLKVDNLTPEVISGETTLYSDISATDSTVQVYSTKGFPNEYGLFQIGNEVFSYTGLTTNTFTGVLRGFSGITSYRTDLNAEELVFNDTTAGSHTAKAKVRNLSALFLKDFYKKLKYTLTPGLEDVDFQSDLDVNNFIKEARSLYESKGTEESFKILFKVLYGVTPKIIDLEVYLPKPSSAEFLRREQIVAERVSGNPANLVGQTIKKSTDDATQGSISEVEVFTRSGISTYYKIGLFVGYNDNALIEGTWKIQPQSKVINPVSVNDTIITVDSTVGFGVTGTLIADDNVITYKDKTVNQFLGCEGVISGIGTGDNIRTSEVFVGYENGDTNKKVELRITGVLSDFETTSDILETVEDQVLYVKNVGEEIKNPEINPSDKEIFANSWIYNTSCRFNIVDYDSSTTTITLSSTIDDSSLKIGDNVDILLGDTQNIAFTNALVAGVDPDLKQVQLNNLTGFTYDSTQVYTLRRKLNNATSSGTPITYGQNKVIADIQNVYNENDTSFYVASNSLPAYDITKNTVKYTIDTAVPGSLDGYDSVTEKYTIISFTEPSLDFRTGDEIYYNPTTIPLNGVAEGYYYIKVLSGGKIKLYQSRSLIASDSPIGFTADGNNVHTFILGSQKDDSINPQGLLRKFHHSQDIKTGKDTKTIPGAVGMFINGVEAINYKSLDKIYYGPLDHVKVYNKGKDYDVLNLPSITIAAGVGTTALVQGVISGNVKEVLVDPQNFDIDDISSVTISGGNGSGAMFLPMVGYRQREVRFDSRADVNGGGINLARKEITFVTEHKFIQGEELVYDSNANPVLTGAAGTLTNNSIYYPEIIDNDTIKVYTSIEDLNAGINPVGLNTNSQGYHKFKRLKQSKTLRSIKVIDGGSGYTNRQLIVPVTGINTVHNSINFKNHGFGNGEKILYSADGAAQGLVSKTGVTTTSQHYQIVKIDDDSFYLTDAGIGGTITSNYERKEFVNITSVGSGWHNFQYPPVELTVNATLSGVGTATQTAGIITATPIVRGEIIDAYLYEKGTGYGSDILNYSKEPIISVKSGKEAEFKPIIANGKIDAIMVTYGGSEYTSPPDLTFVGVGSGIGAKARAIIENGKVTTVVVLDSGIGYDSKTGIAATSVGSNAYLEGSVRSLTLNNFERFGNEILTENNGLQYGMVGYSTAIGFKAFDDVVDLLNQKHSPIIGWAYDGNPIYGPFGYSDAEDANSSVTNLNSGYTVVSSDIIDRPTGFSDGYFVEDYKFTNIGDLDKHNGRYGKTPEFPNGTYAYFAGITTITRLATFPYFVGDSYRSDLIPQLVDQSFDFNNSNLIRNTFPYKASDVNANNDFISEPYETIQQRTVVDSVTKGSVDNFIINESGDNYAVKDMAVFDNGGTNGGGLGAYVSRVSGKSITSIDTVVETYQSASLVWDNASQISVHTDKVHTLLDGDSVAISGVSTFINRLTDSHVIGVSSEKTYLIAPTASNTTVGMVTDIYVSSIPFSVSIGSTIAIGIGTWTENVSVLNIFDEHKVLRIERGTNPGAAHTASSQLNTVPNSFTIPIQTDYFESKIDTKVNFHPGQAIGIGNTWGGASSNKYRIGDIETTISVPHQSIYIPNHPFKTNQEVIWRKPTSASNNVSVSKTETSSTFNLPASGTSQTLYVVNQGRDYIGLSLTKNSVGIGSTALFFRGYTTHNDQKDWKYSIESNFTQETARAEKITGLVAVSTAHGLLNGDIIDLELKSNQSVGIGTSIAVRVKYNSSNDKIIINPTTFANTALNVSTNEFTINKHGFVTGDKVFYDAGGSRPFSGLSTGSYYVYRVDDNRFNLSITKVDAVAKPPVFLDLAAPSSAGTTHEISKVNPQINAVENNNLVFDTSDSSLANSTLRIYYDEEFKNELVSVGGTVTDFSIDRSPTAGVVGAALTLRYSTSLPSRMYYTLERGGFISTSDTEVSNNSEIIFSPSVYNGSYSVTGVGTTGFQISLRSLPESLQCNQTKASRLRYSTSSATARGGVEAMRITSGGLNYKKLPKFNSITSVSGENADIIPLSSTIGRIKQVTIQDPGFDFSADKTLSPEVYISPNITVVDRNTITDVSVVSGGQGYTQVPDVVVVNPTTGLAYNSGVLEAELQGSAISEVKVLQSPKGLSELVNTVYTLNNSNGIGIETCISSPAGIVTCWITTPINGFSVAPFAVGDKVFVEGMQKLSGIFTSFYGNTGIGTTTSGSGFNSPDNSYKFFPVTSVSATNPVKVEFNMSGIVAFAGIAKTDQNGYASLVNQSKYPTFTVTQDPLEFTLNEQLLVLEASGNYVPKDLYLTLNLTDQIKVSGTYELVVGDVIVGRNSGTIATIKTIVENKALFKVDYSLRKDYGWSNDTGKLNEDFQVLPDNDYYQNLSYTIQSPIEYKDLINPVNRLLHTTGLKNFADTGITTTTTIKGKTPVDSGSVALIDIIGEKRVDTISNFDFGIDIDASANKSRYIKFQNKRLSDYINCDTNRVLKIDDISEGFSRVDKETKLWVDLDDIQIGSGYNRYLVQVVNPNSKERQIAEVITLTNSSGDIFTFEKASVGIATTGSNNSYKVTKLGDIAGSDESTLRFDPTDPYTQDYDIKLVKNTFNSSNPGSGTQSIGFVDLTASNVSVAVNATETIASAEVAKSEAFFHNVEVINSVTDETTYVELYIDHDSSDAYISDFYVDNQMGVNGNFIGTFGAAITGGIININFTNSTESNPVLVRSRTVGFGTTAVGIGTYRFLSTGQSAGTELTARYEAKYALTNAPASGSHAIFSTPKTDVTSIKSVVKVGYGNTSALHQLLTIHDGTDVYTTTFPHLSIGSTSGIGTFASTINGSNLELKFFPDPGCDDKIVLQSYSELIQTNQDSLNIPNDLLYGTIEERHKTSAYNGKNTDRSNKNAFDLEHNGVPIYGKEFNPADPSKVTLSTGTFRIADHFFETGEQIDYTAVSTFSDVTAAAMVMTGGAALPGTVFAIKINQNEFQLATSKANATAGTAITFQSAGAGNAHTLVMNKRAAKTVLSLDGIVQSPLTFSPVKHALKDNFGSISASDTIFSLAGISSIQSEDVLRIDEEYVRVKTVGLGTTAVGPISASGNFNLVEVERGFVGTPAASHSDTTGIATVYSGAFNIVNSKIHFVAPPVGNNVAIIDPLTNLPTARSTFGGRVYLRQDYATNQIYDNLSESFTGIGATHTLSINGINTTGIETGSGLVFINNIFQTPTTSNNIGNTYDFIDNNLTGASGITSVRFTGITDDNGEIVLSDYDVNMNQLPRGGLIVSLGSSIGSGYAAPVGAKDIDVVINSSGTITAVGIGTTTVHGSAYRSDGIGAGSTIAGIGVTDVVYEHKWVTASNNAVNGSLTPIDGSYDSFTGLLSLTIPSHGLGASGTVTIANNSISMTCDRDNHTSAKTYPRAGIDPAAGGANRAFTRISSDAISVDVGPGGGRGKGASVKGTVGAGGTLTFSVNAGGSNYISPRIDVPEPSYENLPITGVFRRGVGMTNETGKGLLVTLDVGPATPTPQDNKFGDASNLIDSNNAFISELSAKRMFDRWNNGSNSSYSYPGGFTEADCIDDVEDVLEATSYNLNYGGNDKTYDAANLFVTGVYSDPPPVAGEEEQVIYALHEARDMAVRALRNQKIYTHLGAQYAHTYTSGTVANAVCSGGNYAHTYIPADSSANAINGSLKPTAAVYDAVAGTLQLTFASAHGIANGGNVTIANHSLVFTCARDAHATKHAYPRATDPASGATLTATVGGDNKVLTVTVGTSPLVFKSVVAGAGAEATSYDAKTGDLVLNVGSNHGFLAPTTLNAPTAATYAPTTGVLRLTIAGHGCAVGDYIKIDDNSITFTCARDNHTTEHSYPRSTDAVSGVWLPIHQISTNRIWVNIGLSPDTSAHLFVSATAGIKKANAGIGIGTSKLGFKCTRDATDANPGGVVQQLYPRPGDPFSWNKKQISIASTTTSSVTVNVGVSSTSHTNLQQVFDNTITQDTSDPACANVVSAVHTLVGIVTAVVKTHNAAQLPGTRTESSFETYEVRDFEISRPGYGFKPGDVFKPVGLVTHQALTTPSSEFSLTVIDTFTDNFASWQFGELDYIDSVKDLQNGSRTRFPLKYNGDLLSFETDNDDVDLNAVLLIFINGVIQEPGEHYIFDGGTSFIFTAAPNSQDTVSIFFYRGTRGVDSKYVNINESLKVGDDVQLKQTGSLPGQDARTISGISSSDKIRTNMYTGANIDEVNYRLLDWSKQKVDKNIGGLDVYKSRDSIESLVYPTARIIGDIPATGVTTVFVDDAQFFDYEENKGFTTIISVDSLIVEDSSPVAAAITATVTGLGTVKSLTITDGGSGYVGSMATVFISRPPLQSVVNTLSIGNSGAQYVSAPTLTITPPDDGDTTKTATATATIDSWGNVDGVTVTNHGNGYHTVPGVIVSGGLATTGIGSTLAQTASVFANIRSVGLGVTFIGAPGVRTEVYTGIASALVPIVNGSLSGVASITSPGAGYTYSEPPEVIVPVTPASDTTINTITNVKGFSGIITGITTALGVGNPGTNPLALKFWVKTEKNAGNFNQDLKPGYPIYVTDTVFAGSQVGKGITSINTHENSTVGIGTSFADNVYIVAAWHVVDTNSGIITCNIRNNTPIAGLTTSVVGIATPSIGRFSWGMLDATGTASTPIAIGVTGNYLHAGITSFPTIQRRGFGIRSTGALRK